MNTEYLYRSCSHEQYRFIKFNDEDNKMKDVTDTVMDSISDGASSVRTYLNHFSGLCPRETKDKIRALETEMKAISYRYNAEIEQCMYKMLDLYDEEVEQIVENCTIEMNDGITKRSST